MKISHAVSALYQDYLAKADALKAKVDEVLMPLSKSKTWHYFSRVKSLESFAVKLERGGINSETIFEDFFACTIVVANIKEVQTAVSEIQRFYDIQYKRPKVIDFTHMQSFSFEFDDLRLYNQLKNFDNMPENELSKLTFELQIKTFLQHAWALATHDLIYKSDSIDWAKQRVAYQIKAMLEQAEVAISGADALAQLPELKKNNYESQQLNNINNIIVKKFHSEALPSDIMRLSKSVSFLLKTFGIKEEELLRLIDKETEKGRGFKVTDMSPYGIILQTVINQQPSLLEKVCKSKHRKVSLFIPDGIVVDGLTIEDPSRLISIATIKEKNIKALT